MIPSSHHLLIIAGNHHMFKLIFHYDIHWCRANVTPSWKRSMEEKRIAIAPSLITIPDATPVMAGLTESSSSGK